MTLPKNLSGRLIALALIGFFLVPHLAHAAEQGKLLDRIVAVVDDGIILQSELDQRVAEVRKRLANSNTMLPPDDILRHQVLEQMITLKLELSIAEQNNMQVSDDQLNQAMASMAKRNHMTLSEFPAALKNQGVNYAQLREEVRQQMLIGRVQQQVLHDRLHITPREVDDEMAAEKQRGNNSKEYHLSQILLTLPRNATGLQVRQIQDKAEKIYQKLKKGADFATTAVAESQGQQALNGGDLGWRKDAELPTLFAAEVRNMKPGEISKPIKSASGYHIVKLDGERSGNSHIVTQVHVRHILITPNAVVSNADAHQQIEAIRKQIIDGASFAKLAQKYSNDPGSAENGGDLGWTNPGTFVPTFEQVVSTLKPGQISQPFRTRFGWHIAELLGRRKRNQTDEMLKQRAYNAVRVRKESEIIDDWIRELRGQAYIKLRLADNS